MTDHTADFAALRARVEAYAFDQADDARPFSVRLRQEQRWSARRAARAMTEYRRFLVLAGAAGHTVSPSPDVDAVWHLHLTDTRRYWDDFCPRVLGRPLHHDPSRGGPQEAAKHRGLYAQTMASYERLFGEPAPRDLWPQPGPGSLRHVATLARDAWARAWRPTTAVGATLVTFGCAQIYDSASPGAIQGPQFIQLYFVALIVGLFVTAGLQRWAANTSAGETVTAANLNPYELAYLAGGVGRVFETALLKLYRAGQVVTGPKKGKLAIGAPLPADAPPIDVAIWTAVQAGRSLDVNVKVQALPLAQRLQDLGLLPDARARMRMRLVALAVFGSLLALGVVRFWFGQVHHRPTGLLAFALAAAVFLLIVAAFRSANPNSNGRRVKREAREATPKPKGDQGDDSQALKIAALYGLAAAGAGIAGAVVLRSYVVNSVSSDGGGSSCGGGGGCGG
jgi:uncharacterized protein (TIGR04222 family)